MNDLNKNYIVLVYDENELEDLENEVCSLMKEGYEPLGGLSVRAGGIRGANFMQAMLRTTK